MPVHDHRVTTGEGDVRLEEQMDIVLRNIRWAYEALHMSQAGFIRLFLDLGCSEALGESKSESTIKAYLQGNIPKNSPQFFQRFINAVSSVFKLAPEDLCASDIGRAEFTEKVRTAFIGHSFCTAHSHPEKKLLAQSKNIEKPSPDVFPGWRFALNLLIRQKGWRAAVVSIIAILCLLPVLNLLSDRHGDVATRYPSRIAPEIRSATLDNRDVWLNGKATPMISAYGSKLCVQLASSDLFASVFLEDRGYFFNQEGRMLVFPGDEGEKCTGIWPGHPDAYHTTTYALFIVVSKHRIPVTGDSDRLADLPQGSYWGPTYIQRTE